MAKHFLPVEVTKTRQQEGVEYAHVTGTHGLAMWVPTADLVGETKPEPKAKPETKPEPKAETK